MEKTLIAKAIISRITTTSNGKKEFWLSWSKLIENPSPYKLPAKLSPENCKANAGDEISMYLTDTGNGIIPEYDGFK